MCVHSAKGSRESLARFLGWHLTVVSRFHGRNLQWQSSVNINRRTWARGRRKQERCGYLIEIDLVCLAGFDLDGSGFSMSKLRPCASRCICLWGSSCHDFHSPGRAERRQQQGQRRKIKGLDDAASEAEWLSARVFAGRCEMRSGRGRGSS
jgi:hypothetical protein